MSIQTEFPKRPIETVPTGAPVGVKAKSFTVLVTAKNTIAGYPICAEVAEAGNVVEAATIVRRRAASSLGLLQSDLQVVGVIEGHANFLALATDSRDAVTLPAPRVLTHIRVELDRFEGATFSGGAVEAEIFLENLSAEWERGEEAIHTLPNSELGEHIEEILEILDDHDVGDDPHGDLREQVLAALKEMLVADAKGEEVRRVTLTMCGGVKYEEEDGGLVKDEDGQWFDPTDITVHLVPVYCDEVVEGDDGDD